MTASSGKWVLPRLLDELRRGPCSYVPTAPLTVQHSNCSCKSNYILMKFVYFLRSFLHDGFLFLKKKLAFLGSIYRLLRFPLLCLIKENQNKSLILLGSIPCSPPHPILCYIE